MPSYYEVLKVESTASIEEIQTAIDEQYNQFLRLVNHQNPEVVEQANRALRQLEQIRSTLTDPGKRADYDQSLDFGGLADPSAILQAADARGFSMTPAPPRPRDQAVSEPTTAWKCEQCGKMNRIGSKICAECGAILARDCPNGCGNVVQLREKFCSTCGKSVAEALAQLQLEWEQAQSKTVEEIQAKIQTKRDEIDRLNWFAENVPEWSPQELNSLLDNAYGGCFIRAVEYCLWLGGIFGVVLLLAGDTSGEDFGSILVIAIGSVGLMVAARFVRQNNRMGTQNAIEAASKQRQRYINHAERRLQEEQAKQFDPLSPKPYSTAKE